MSPIEKGDRVRVHADGDVVSFDIAVGLDLVAVTADAGRTRFQVALLLREGEDDDKPRGQRRERLQGERTAWFYSDEVEPTLDKPLVVGNGWRDVCADMIRDGKDLDAVTQLVANAPDVVLLLKLLHDLELAVAKMPTLGGVFGEAWAIKAAENVMIAYTTLSEHRAGNRQSDLGDGGDWPLGAEMTFGLTENELARLNQVAQSYALSPSALLRAWIREGVRPAPGSTAFMGNLD